MRAGVLERFRSRLPVLPRHVAPPPGRMAERDVVADLLEERQMELERIHDELLALESRLRRGRARCESDYWLG